jgi:hypothetical protein
VSLRPVVTLLIALASVAGCATWQPPAQLSDEQLQDRAVTRSAQGVQVRASLLSPADSVQLLGVDVVRKGIRPVWVEIANGTRADLWLLKSGTGPDYFSPLEAAWAAHVTLGGDTNDHIDELFEQVALPNPIPAGETRRGLLFLAPQPRRTILNLDLIGSRTLVPISLILTVPGSEPDATDLRLIEVASAPKVDYTDLDSLRVALESLPGCASTVADPACTQPLNVILIGTLEDLGAATSRRDFRRDVRESDLALRVYDRPPDFVTRKHAAGAAALWIRVWLAPITWQGKPVFVGQVARPIGGRFGDADAPDVRLYGDIDEARDRLIQGMMYSGGLQSVGFLSSSGMIPRSQPRRTSDGASYFTDGHRGVLFFETRPLSISDVQFLDWVPLIQQAEERASAAGETVKTSPH